MACAHWCAATELHELCGRRRPMCRRAHDQCRMSGRPRYECGVEYPQRRYTHLLTSHARARASRTGGDTRACTHAMLHTHKSATKATVDTETRRRASATVGATKAIADTATRRRAAARGARRRDARARAACTGRRRGRRLHGVGRGARHAAIGVARDGRGRGGGARACRRGRDSEVLGGGFGRNFINDGPSRTTRGLPLRQALCAFH